MSITIIIIIATLYTFISKKLFGSYFNHLSIYAVSWAFICSNYELKLIRFVNITNEAWFIIFLGSFFYFLGVLTYYFYKNDPDKFKIIYKRISINNNEIKILYKFIVITAFLNLLISILNWKFLISKFGSITNVFIQANKIYRMRIEGDLPEVIPYFYTLGYVSVFLSGIYAAYTNKLKIVMLIAFISVVMKDVAGFGREGILLALLVFIFSFLFTTKSLTGRKIFKFKENKKNVLIILLILILAITGANIVRGTRGVYERFKGTSNILTKSTIADFVTPSLYFYFSSHIGVFSKYLENPTQNNVFGAQTFLPIHSILAKFELLPKPSFYQKGYFIPQWSNTGTYLREIYEDFGILGVFIVPYLLGLFITYLWYRYHKNPNLVNLVWLVYFYIVSTMTWLDMYTRSSKWFIGMIFTYFAVKYFEYLRNIINNDVSKQN